MTNPDKYKGHSRLLICGGPRTGKTTLALALGEATGIRVRSTDDLIGSHDWSEASEEVSNWLDVPGPKIIEGVACARALRKWLARNPTGNPDTAIVLLRDAVAPLSKGQAAMAAGVWTVWREIANECDRRGMVIL